VDSKVGSDLRGCRSEPIDHRGFGGSALDPPGRSRFFACSRFPLRPFTPQPHEFLVLFKDRQFHTYLRNLMR
jgi:hypothetical protein